MAKTTNILDLNNRLEKVEKENVAQNNYNSLKNRPKINGNLLTGDKTGAQLGLANAQDVGNLTTLTTTDKSSAVAAINEVNGVLVEKQNVYGAPAVKIGEIAVGGTSTSVTATKNGYISLVYEMTKSNMNIKGKIRDAIVTQLGVSFDIVADAYTSEPICTIPSKNGRTYQVTATAGHNGISIYQF